MTAVAQPADRSQPPGRRTAAVPWRQLVRVTVRQHRRALLAMGLAVAVLAIVLAVTGISFHEFAARNGINWQGTRRGVDYAGGTMQALALGLQLVPVLAGMFLGAPLVARETQTGTVRLAWTQTASRARWLLAQAVPVACLLALAALGLATEFAWWRAPLADGPFGYASSWGPTLFNLNPLPLAGWIVFGFVLGVFLGAVLRRIVPAMAATLAGYGALLAAVSLSWRMHYLPPIHRSLAVQFTGGGGYSYSAYWGPQRPDILSRALGWPGGRLLSSAAQFHPAAWLRLHHIVLWLTYQPASRHLTFQLIELGWLIAASVILLAVTAVLIRRRSA